MVESIISGPGAAVLQDPQPEGHPESGEAVTAPLGRILVDAGVISEEQLSQAKDVARREKTPVAQVLVRDGLVLSRELATLTALHLGLAMVDLRSQSIEPEAVAQLPERISRKCAVLALRGCKGTLTVAMTDPTDLGLLQDLSALTGRFIDPVIATIEDILEHIDIAYRLTETLALASQEGRKPAGRVTAGALQEASPARIIDLLLAQALQDRASDVHIEPAESRLRIRFRIDGILHDAVRLPQELRPALISRIKIVSGMNIAERRRPQDGQFTVNLHDRNVDVRVAVSNTVEGEMAVLRLLDKGFTLRGLGQLGLSSDDLERYRALLRAPYGMLVVCGPTGAGKSTTLYASVLQMNRTEKKVISLEDPVEYRINDVNQMQVHADAGITFATQLRSVLRLDPDVILVGEVRDQETAIIATQAALTGHLVLTSLHANDAVSALVPLRDLGVAPYLITSALAGVAAQRMVRAVCSGCGTLATRPLEEQQTYAQELGESRERFVYGAGCNMCAQTGYLGRTGVFEVLRMSDGLRELFLDNAPRHRLSEQALADGMTSLSREAFLKVRDGITTPYEVMRVLFTVGG